MSDSWLQVIPTDPEFVPAPEQRQALLDALAQLCPGAERVSEIVHEQVEFVEAGEDVVIHCPLCRAEVDGEWFMERVDAQSETGFVDLAVTIPCCSGSVNLNDLVYDWPQGWARWVAEVLNPGRDELRPDEVAELQAALQHPIRVVWTHL